MLKTSDRFQQVPLYLWLRHGALLMKYGSLHKYLNACLAFLHYLRGSRTIKTMPAFLKVEICRNCTVKCLYCSEIKEDLTYPFERFKELVNIFANHAFMVQLYEIGEPLLNVQVLDYVRYAHAKNLGTVISSSLSMRKPDAFWQDLTTSGLDRLIVAIDGATEAVYKRYRTQGNFSLVMSNLEKILRYRSTSKNKMIVEWQMIDFPWNKCEQDVARKLAASKGCDIFRIIPDANGRRKYASEPVQRKINCLWPYVAFLVNAYGDVQPCFKPGCKPGSLGNLNEETFEGIWNGTEIRRIRNRRLIRFRDGCRTCRD